MRKTLLSFILLFFATITFAQRNGDFNYSLGVSRYSYMQMPKIFNQAEDVYLSTNFSSYLLKFNDNLFSYRLNGSYFTRNLEFNNNCDNCEFIAGEVKDLSFKMGFEKNFNYNIIQPYIALDLGYRSNRFEGTAMDNNPARLAANQVQTSSSVISTKEGITLSPVFGIKVNPIKQVSVFVESNLELFYSYERQERVTQDAENTRNISKFNKTQYLINPISVGVQIHFGNKN